MRVVIGSDGKSGATDILVKYLGDKGFQTEKQGALNAEQKSWIWPKTAHQVALKVANGECDLGILLCWTGTGVSMVANKVRGVRAALCHDKETAAGARKWNDANILAISLRTCSEHIALEMIEAFLNTNPEPDKENQVCLDYLKSLDQNTFD